METTIKTQSNLLKYKFVNLDSNVIVTPVIPTGRLAEDIFSILQENKETVFNNNRNLSLYLKNGELEGSNLFEAVRLSQLLREYGVRVACPEDWNEQVQQMIEGRFYTDSPTAVLRDVKDSWNSDNEGLAKVLAEYVDMSRVKREPVWFRELKLETAQNDYGLELVPEEDSSIIYDERFLGKYNMWKFTERDNLGLPKDLDKNRGNRTWYTREDGLSGVYLSRDLDLYSDNRYLASSNEDGRVVLVSGEATSKKI